MESAQIIRNIISSEDPAHTFLFIGDQELISKAILDLKTAIGVKKEDISEINPAEETGKKGEIKIGDVQSFIHEISLSPHGKSRIGVIYRADRLNLSAANALLKTLEEPPKSVYLVLTAANEALYPTIKSRCQSFKFFDASAEQNQDGEFTLDGLKHEKLAVIFPKIEQIAKEGKSEIFLSRLTNLLRINLINSMKSDCADLIRRCEETRKQISKNANPRLALEALILEIRETL